MKKYFIILAAAFAALLSINSCASKDDTTPETPAGPTYLSVLTGEWKVTRWFGYEYEESDPYPDGEGEFFLYDISEEDVWKFTITSDKTISEYEVINNTIHENSWNLVFDSLDGPIKYNEDIYGKMSHLNWDMDCGFNVIDDNEIEIIVISNLYFNIYRCKRIQK